MTARVSVLLKSSASPDVLPFSLCNKKRHAIRHTYKPLFPTTLSIPSYDTIDSVLRHREVGRAKDLSASPRTTNFKINTSTEHFEILVTKAKYCLIDVRSMNTLSHRKRITEISDFSFHIRDMLEYFSICFQLARWWLQNKLKLVVIVFCMFVELVISERAA